MKLRTFLTAVGIALAISFAAATPAEAEKTIWKSIAMACVPSSGTIESGNYVTTAGRVKHKPGRLGTITFICPFEARGLSVRKQYRIRAHIKRVSNHPRPREYVRAQLRGARDRNGEVFTILQTDGDNFQSSDDPMVEIFSQREIIGWSDEITYYVQLTIERDEIREAVGVEQIPAILSVEILED